MFKRFLTTGIVLIIVACGGGDGDSRSLGAGGASSGSGGKAGATNMLCPAGSEGCACYGNDTCDAGLTCASNLCVELAGTGGSGNASGTGGMTASGGMPATGGTGGTQQCLGDAAVCSDDPNACCVGLTCVVDERSPWNGTCTALCRSDNECATGCCALLTDGLASACAPPHYCSALCRPAGSACLDAPSSCCGGSLCVPDDPSYTSATCSAICSIDFDCISNCCVRLSDGSFSVCSDPSYCSAGCLPAGTRPCGVGTPCCPDSYCMNDTGGTTCAQICSSDFQCATGCCARVPSTTVYACQDPAYCP